MPAKRLTEAELTDSIDRMYAQEKDHRAQKATQLGVGPRVPHILTPPPPQQIFNR